MTSVKLKFKESSVSGKEGTLYIQVIHGREVAQVNTGLHIHKEEWDYENGSIVKGYPESGKRAKYLDIIRGKILLEKERMNRIVEYYENGDGLYKVADVVRRYREASCGTVSVFEYIRIQIARLQRLGKERTAETYGQMLNSLVKYRKGMDLYFDMIDTDMMEQYEIFMRVNHLCRNTSSFYMRILRCVYNRAVEEGITVQRQPFRHVYTGVDKTPKRAVTINDIRNIKALRLLRNPVLEFARDIFLFSFYMRGMSFIDIAYLRKKDMSNGFITYNRRKTGQQIVVRLEKPILDIIMKYTLSGSEYLLPVIERQDGTERKQYLNKMLLVNRKLKIIAGMAGIQIPLSMYVARHSWASVAKSMDVSLSVISLGMGHDNEETTRIYLDSIQTDQIDDANVRILKEL
ncbi:site-specific integrase [Xylanibacter muris]|uniref:Site-specific integrase n=1 Tax=Xylanibacter muris TaxID=2736290 RepID=A0ABX2AP98_9BACT|nr:site-specific integrase [Xylanibacter muris]NPD92960.1 site-specific integrase [Xylanibacter muris]